MKELSFVFFQAVLGTTFLACVLYLVFFVSQNGKVRKVARTKAYSLLPEHYKFFKNWVPELDVERGIRTV